MPALLQALRNAGAEGGRELTWFFGELLQMARDPEDPRSKSALAIIGDCLPKYKPESLPVTIPLSDDPTIAHRQIVKAVASGQISIDAGAMLGGLLEAGQRIETAGELTAEITAMREELEIVKSELAARGVGAEGAPQILPATINTDPSPADIPPA